MEYLDYQNLAEISGNFVIGHQIIPAAERNNAFDTAHAGSARQLLLREDAAQWGRPVINFKGIINGLIVSAIFWVATLLLII